MKISIINITAAALLIFYGCGSSTGSRYEEDKEEEKTVTETPEMDDSKKTDVTTDKFDMSPYHSTFEFHVKEDVNKTDIWYGYDSTTFPGNEQTVIVEAGYRVEVLATDDLDEANNMKSELRFRLKQNIYIIFDPPFYRVRTGDFKDRISAENQSFKLKQLGYQESRVVSDSIKVTGLR